MAQQQAIKLKIAGKSYSFTLKHEANEEQSLAEKEELYRLAEREVNAYVTRFEKAKYEGFSTQDCLAKDTRGDRIEKSASIIVLYHTFKKNLPA